MASERKGENSMEKRTEEINALAEAIHTLSWEQKKELIAFIGALQDKAAEAADDAGSDCVSGREQDRPER